MRLQADDMLHTYEILSQELTEHIENDLKTVTSVIIIHDDNVVYEHYFNGSNETTLLPMRSMTKSMTATLIGIAVGKGFIKSEEQPIRMFFEYPEQLESSDEVLDTELHHLLSMTSGFQLFDNDLPLLIQGDSSDWISSIMRCKVKHPGVFAYKGCEMHLLSAIIARAAKMSTAQFAEQFLFHPLGIDNYHWSTDPQGNPLGSTGLKLTTRDITKVGTLYLKQGVWNDEHIVPSQWIVKATSPRSDGDIRYGAYGYGWWITTFAEYDAYMAAGAKGQYLINIPLLNLTVTITCDPNEDFVDPRSMVNRFIIPAFAR